LAMFFELAQVLPLTINDAAIGVTDPARLPT
jgi:hypothetical protein